MTMAWWTAVETLETIGRFWLFVYVWLVLVVVAAYFLARRNRLFYRQVMWATVPFAFSAAIILCGVVFNNPNGASDTTSSFAEILVWTLFIGQLSASALLVSLFRGARLLTGIVSLGALWLSFWGGFVSLMSISGDWI
jgi:glucan phosphoethanolaminetransferase (alkaline phosphatase superfamily)